MRFGAGYRMALSPTDLLLLDASAKWTDKRLKQAYFGVDPIQATRSGQPAADSPIIVDRQAMAVSAGISYRF